jgi:hypothetical protein
MEPGGLIRRVAFRPAKSSFLRPNVALEAFLCLDCGNVEIVGDVKMAEALVRERGFLS